MDDEETALAELGYRRQVLGSGTGSVWRLTSDDGVTSSGVSASDRSARREAAFAAFAFSAIARVRARA